MKENYNKTQFVQSSMNVIHTDNNSMDGITSNVVECALDTVYQSGDNNICINSPSVFKETVNDLIVEEDQSKKEKGVKKLISSMFGKEFKEKLQKKYDLVAWNIMMAIDSTADALLKFKYKMEEFKDSAMNRYDNIKELVESLGAAVSQAWNKCMKFVEQCLKITKQTLKGKWVKSEEERKKNRNNKFKSFQETQNRLDQ